MSIRLGRVAAAVESRIDCVFYFIYEDIRYGLRAKSGVGGDIKNTHFEHKFGVMENELTAPESRQLMWGNSGHRRKLLLTVFLGSDVSDIPELSLSAPLANGYELRAQTSSTLDVARCLRFI